MRSMTSAVVTVALALPVAAAAQLTTPTYQGIQLYEDNCGMCHTAPADERTPTRAALSQLSAEAVLEALTTGRMQINAEPLDDRQRRLLAQYVAGAPFGTDVVSGEASAMPNRCGASVLVDPSTMPAWSGWGPDATNARFQSAEAAGLTADDVPNLTLKWVFGLPNSRSAYGQPSVASGRVFLGTDTGYVYALGAETGCVHWSFEADAGVRTAISIGPVTRSGGSGYAAFFGDLQSNVYAVDPADGSLLWREVADAHPVSRITGAPTLHDGRLYVPVASLEEVAGSNDSYECCTFRGHIIAYDSSTGERLWTGYTIPEEPRRTRRNEGGTQLWGPAGAAIWSAPTVDAKRGAIYAATGNGYTAPAHRSSDAVVAFSMETGELLWVQQATPGDHFFGECEGDRCPDVDFGNSPILRTLPDGGDILVVGQKSGVAWGINPDDGTVVWRTRVGQGSAVGGMEWGSAADGELGYFPVADPQLGADGAGGLAALRLGTGERVWYTRPPVTVDCPGPARACVPSQSAAISVIPGVVFSGTVDGVMRAYSTAGGEIIWEHNTRLEYSAVNGVQTRGGTINGPGPTVAGGMLFVTSGYSHPIGGIPGNALLVFGVE